MNKLLLGLFLVLLIGCSLQTQLPDQQQQTGDPNSAPDQGSPVVNLFDFAKTAATEYGKKLLEYFDAAAADQKKPTGKVTNVMGLWDAAAFDKANELETAGANADQAKKDELTALLTSKAEELDKTAAKPQFIQLSNVQKRLLARSRMPSSFLEVGACECQCNTGFVRNGVAGTGFGKYCGYGYGIEQCGHLAKDQMCSSTDALCYVHDVCVGHSGYRGSCRCNLALIAQLGTTHGKDNGWAGCEKAKHDEAITGMLKLLCMSAKWVPEAAGGCSAATVDDWVAKTAGVSRADLTAACKIGGVSW